MMESEEIQYTIPECPLLRPSHSNEDFDDITLEDNFALSEIETQTPESDNTQDDFIEDQDEPKLIGKRSFHEVKSTTKPSFQSFFDRPQRRQINVKMADHKKKSTVENMGKLSQHYFVFYFLYIFLFIFQHTKIDYKLSMRKKQANLYFPDKKYRQSPYLTKEEIKDFQSEFTLFNREINLLKLKEAMLNQNYHQSSKPVFNFVDKISQETDTIGFNEYLTKMTESLGEMNQGQLIAEMLDQQGKGEISKQMLKQILEEALGREILPQEMSDIMVKVFDTNSEKISIDAMKKVVNKKNQFLK